MGGNPAAEWLTKMTLKKDRQRTDVRAFSARHRVPPALIEVSGHDAVIIVLYVAAMPASRTASMRFREEELKDAPPSPKMRAREKSWCRGVTSRPFGQMNLGDTDDRRLVPALLLKPGDRVMIGWYLAIARAFI